MLVFAEGAAAASRKTFSKRERLNRKIHSGLLSHTLKTASGSGFPFYWISEDQQMGNTFGARLLNAMEAIFAKGFERLIVIGSDVPEITPSIIQKADRGLDHHDLVLGPAHDGGTYLIAMHRKAFPIFEGLDIPWRTKRDLFSLVISWQANNRSYLLLDPLSDLDSMKDIESLLGSKGHLKGLSFLLVVIEEENPLYYHRLLQPPLYMSIGTCDRRGPPAMP